MHLQLKQIDLIWAQHRQVKLIIKLRLVPILKQGLWVLFLSQYHSTKSRLFLTTDYLKQNCQIVISKRIDKAFNQMLMTVKMKFLMKKKKPQRYIFSKFTLSKVTLYNNNLLSRYNSGVVQISVNNNNSNSSHRILLRRRHYETSSTCPNL